MEASESSSIPPVTAGEDLWSADAEAFLRYLTEEPVRRRMAEFLGGSCLQDATCLYVTRPSPSRERPFDPRPPGELWTLAAEGGAVARSLWDRESLLAHLDVEHVHFDRPSEPFADPRRNRALLAPVVAAIDDLLADQHIAPLRVLTGRGQHWLWRISQRSRGFGELVRLGTLGEGLRRWYAEPVTPVGAAVGVGLGSAFDGLGRVLEHLAHQALERAAAATPVPLTLTAVRPGTAAPHRECVSIDLSAFGDPLDRRSVRIPFGAYLKGRRLGAAPFLVCLPAPEGGEAEALAAMADLEAAAELARLASARIPDASHATAGLVRAYLGSELAEVHRAFYAEEADPPEVWPETYDRLRASDLPACVGRVLEAPNDLALQPAAIQLVVRVLVALGWHPRHVAGLLRSKLERDHGWIPDLHFSEPGCRADFYVRLFTGLELTGRSRFAFDDFSCEGTRDKDLCPGTGCGWVLRHLDPLRREAVASHG